MGFDYKRAWLEVAKPAFEALPAEVLQVLEATRSEVGNLRQERGTLDVVGASEDLQAAFAALPADILACAARTVYFYGHWSSRRDLQDGGLYWKFSNLADQALCRGLGIERHRGSDRDGMSLAVHQGCLRVQFSTPETWVWREMGLATPDVLAAIRAAHWRPLGSYDYDRAARDAWIEAMVGIANSVRLETVPDTGPIAGFFNLAPYGLQD